jgi:predicted lactoylglutathione lyase
MIDHLGMPVSDLARSAAFYLKALAPLGISIIMQVSAEQTGEGAAVGFGAKGKPFFWIGEGFRPKGEQHVHVAFTAMNRDEVDMFYRAAIAAGGKDNGPPGLRPHYHANYYAAFVLDPDGNNIEAVCHAPL